MLADFRMVNRFRVPFSDVDMMQHVNNTSYLRWAEQMRTEYLAEIFEEAVGGRRGLILARMEIIYESPIAYRERVAAGVRLSRFGTKSLDFSHEIWSEDRAKRCARIESTLVAMNYETNQTIAIPDEWRLRSAAYEPAKAR